MHTTEGGECPQPSVAYTAPTQKKKKIPPNHGVDLQNCKTHTMAGHAHEGRGVSTYFHRVHGPTQKKEKDTAQPMVWTLKIVRPTPWPAVHTAEEGYAPTSTAYTAPPKRRKKSRPTMVKAFRVVRPTPWLAVHTTEGGFYPMPSAMYTAPPKPTQPWCGPSEL